MNEFTVVVGPHITITPQRVSGARKFYYGRTLRYYIHGAVHGRRDAIMAALMSHAYENGETLMTLSKWTEGK